MTTPTRIPSPGAGIGASTLATVVLMTMQMKVLFPVLAVAGLGVFYFWPEDPILGEVATPGPVEPASSNLVAAGRIDSPPPAATESPTRQIAPAPMARLVGRLVRHEDHSPLSGEEVWLMPASREGTIGADGQSSLQVRSQAGVPPLARAVTDRSGRFELTVPVTEPEGCEVEVEVHLEGYVPMSSRSCRPAAGGTIDLGVCKLHEGTTITGQVRDTDGQPVAELKVRLSWRDDPGRGRERQFHLLEYSPKPLLTDAVGAFRTAVPWPTGTYWITFDDYSVQLAQEARAFRKVEAGTFLDLIVRRGTEQLKGLVVDDAGEPVAGLRVTSGDGMSNTHSMADGTFVLQRRSPTGKRFGLVLWREDFRLLATEETFTWGQKGVRLVVPRGQTLELQVVQAPGLEAVERFDLTLQHVGDRRVYSRAMGSEHRQRTRHPGGRVDLEGLLPGTYRALVVRYYLSVERRFELRPGQTEQKLVLPEQSNLEVYLVDGRGRPVAGSLCELMQRPTADGALALVPRRFHREVGGSTGLYRPGGTTRIAAEKINAKGRLHLPMPKLSNLVLRIHGESHAPLLYDGDLHPESGTLRLVVQKGAHLVGQLDPPALVRALKPALVLRSLDREGVWFPAQFSSVPAGQAQSPVQLDGGFRLDRIPAGSWEVHLFFIARGRGGAGLYHRRPLTVVRDLKAGESRQLKLDINHLAPAVVRGQAMFQGRPAPFARLDLMGEKIGGFQAAFAVFDADQQGRFEGSLVPGTYRVKAVVRDPETGEDIPCTYTGRLTAGPGAELLPTLDLVPVRPK